MCFVACLDYMVSISVCRNEQRSVQVVMDRFVHDDDT